jgi:hypothetical protein
MKIAADEYHVDLCKQVRQVHKDYNLSQEKARRTLFQQSRPMNDYAHLLRFTRSALIPKTRNMEDVNLLISMFQLTRFLPTLQLFDAIWAEFLTDMEQEGLGEAVTYLRKSVFTQLRISNMARVFKVTAAHGGGDTILFGAHWAGVLGTMPGTAGGTQPLEAMHAYWQGLIK